MPVVRCQFQRSSPDGQLTRGSSPDGQPNRLAIVDEVVFKYFDASNTLEEVFGDTGVEGIVMNTIPEVFEIIVENAFGLEYNCPNINDYIEEWEIDFSVEALSDTQINLMLTRIRNVLNMSPTGDASPEGRLLTDTSKQYILQLYSVATVKDPGYDWHSYIMYNSNYEIVDDAPVVIPIGMSVLTDVLSDQ